ncbi:MAG: ferrous iron transport protein A [Candidatus Caenarcaniphilales bacterium]|nr:ferrous iron transport protein A [Candidatus Caenarcaniphilales bacterium]
MTLFDLRKNINKECFLTIIGTDDEELQMHLDRWGICFGKVLVRKGPWGSYILSYKNEEFAIGPALAKKLIVEMHSV